MKTSIMLLKAVVVIAIFTAIPHALAQWTGQTEVEPITYYDYAEAQEWTAPEAEVEEAKVSNPSVEEAYQHPLVGYWYVEYAELEVGVAYEFKEENGILKAYSVEIYDKDGNKATDNTLSMTVKSFDETTGTADYFIEYEGEKYEVESVLKLTGDKLEVSYSYYGYEGKEIWEKVKE